MTDNVEITSGAGTAVATDDVGGAHFQRIKLDIGGDGASSPVTSANPLPVTIFNGSIPVTGTFWQTTQPVSGSVSVSNFPSSQAVTGTFWPVTQPVSIASMPSTPVTGTFWRATQPVSIAATVAVSGPLTDTQLRASAIPVSGSFSAVDVESNTATFRGRATTYRMVGRAGTTPRRLLAIWNAVGSGKVVHVKQVAIDLIQTAAMAVTVVPPIIRIYRISAIPTNGTALTKVAKDSTQSSAAGVSLFQDASADGTNSASALAATTTAGTALTEEFAPRLITAAGYEMFDRAEFFEGKDVLVRPGEGLVLTYDLTLATQEPASTHTIATIDWWEA